MEIVSYNILFNICRTAKLTHEISVFTDSILNMDSYLIGVIEVYPKEILEEGIRKELIKLISALTDSIMVFKGNDIDNFV